MRFHVTSENLMETGSKNTKDLCPRARETQQLDVAERDLGLRGDKDADMSLYFDTTERYSSVSFVRQMPGQAELAAV